MKIRLAALKLAAPRLAALRLAALRLAALKLAALRLAALVAVAFAAAVWPVAAHHSFAAEYDASKAIRITGVISKVEWTNPHSYLYIDVKDDQGNPLTWTCGICLPA